MEKSVTYYYYKLFVISLLRKELQSSADVYVHLLSHTQIFQAQQHLDLTSQQTRLVWSTELFLVGRETSVPCWEVVMGSQVLRYIQSRYCCCSYYQVQPPQETQENGDF